MRHQGHIAVVTGGAQGIGAGIVEVLHKNGAKVAIIDRQRDKALKLSCDISGDDGAITVIEADISDKPGCEYALQQVIDRFGAVDILVNNAALARNKDYIGKLSDSDWADQSKLTIEAVTNLSEIALPYLQRSKCPAIVNVSSVTATKIAQNQASWPYHVSKAGLEQLTRYLAVKLGQSNIRVNAVAPGLVDRSEGVKLTDFKSNQQVISHVVPLNRVATASDIGEAVSFLSSQEASFITGQVLVVDGGMGIAEVFGAGLSILESLDFSN